MGAAFDVIVIGSGASGVHAAHPLVEAGRSVLMLDVGNEGAEYEGLIPQASFVANRRSDPDQHRYFLGDHLEGIAIGKIGAGAQLTPPREFVLRGSESIAPTAAENFSALQSFASGGLAEAWGAVAFPFTDHELSRCGLPVAQMSDHYEIVARRIGVSGRAHDDLESLHGALGALQPALELDHNAAKMLTLYERRRDRIRRGGGSLGHAFLAALSQPLGSRYPNNYGDMDFWTNVGESVYRPHVTLRELERRPNFRYHRRVLASRFSESEKDGVSVNTIMLDGRGEEAVTGRALVIAAGSLGTTRIVLRSLDSYDCPVPFACNPHTYIPCVHYRGLGTAHRDHCHSLAQLTMIHDPTGNRERLVQGQLYSYRSLLLFRLLKETPLPYREGLRIIRALAPSLVIWVVQHADEPEPGKFCILRRGEDVLHDRLEIGYRCSDSTLRRIDDDETAMLRHIRRLGCWPSRPVHPGHGSSVHYGGQFPMTQEPRPLTTETSGRLRGTQSVYLADGATFAYLPAKGLTLTLMANANRVGTNLVRVLSR